VQWFHDDKQFRPWLAAGDAYYAPFLHGYDNHPMWENDPRMKPYKDSVGTSHLPGWPGPSGRAASENLAKYVITDMYASAAQGKSTREVIATAVSQLKQIYGAS
jgi:multiple sugar transport system substrate-binding protein